MTIIIGEWRFDARSRRLRRGQDERRLSPKAADVLSALAETPGETWSRGDLMERAWRGVRVGEEVLTHAVAEIRKALGDDFRKARMLETVHKRGYRLMCAVAHRSQAGPAREPRAPFDLHAYASYLSACERYERGGPANNAAAVELFSAAIRADPAFAPAHVGLAKAFIGLDCGFRMEFDEALAHCAAARKLKSGFADAWAVEALALFIRGDVEAGVACFGTALDLEPDSAETHYLFARACMGRLALAPAALMLERAARLRAEDYHALVLAGKVHKMMGDDSRARADFARALPRVEARLAIHPDDFRALSDKARCLRGLGREDEAFGAADLAAAHADPLPYQLACVLATADRCERALDILEAAVDAGFRFRGWLDRDPEFDAVRGTRRFRRIAASIPATAF
jgi:DNA-binding winged helix-turn-helix (wHTH) protein/Flp pilus assembly protein TadD